MNVWTIILGLLVFYASVIGGFVLGLMWARWPGNIDPDDLNE